MARAPRKAQGSGVRSHERGFPGETQQLLKKKAGENRAKDFRGTKANNHRKIARCPLCAFLPHPSGGGRDWT